MSSEQESQDFKNKIYLVGFVTVIVIFSSFIFIAASAAN